MNTVMPPFSAPTPLVCPRPSRLPKAAYALNLAGAFDATTPIALRKSATLPLLSEISEPLTNPLEASNVGVLESSTERPSELQPQASGAQPSPAPREPDDLALKELLEIISSRPSFHSLSKTAVTTPAYLEYPAIPRHHSSFEPRRASRKSHSHSYSLGHINWNINPELEFHRESDTPAVSTPSSVPVEEEEGDDVEEEDPTEGLHSLIDDFHVACASPIPRTQNPMPCNSPFFTRPCDDSSKGHTGILAPELYLSTNSSLVQGLLARHKALNSRTTTSGTFVGVC